MTLHEDMAQVDSELALLPEQAIGTFSYFYEVEQV